MKKTNEPEPAPEVPRKRISSLSETMLRINASLDVATVLREVVDSARALTGARYGAITTVDGNGRPQDFITSGVSEEEEQRLANWLPDGPRLFQHFRDLNAPLRVDNLPAYGQVLGFSSDLMLTDSFQAMPMRHLGKHVGIFFLGSKQDGAEFTDEDEEVLVLFAAQAAMAIANARTHRDEQRARADLEALVETSPVGVVVLAAATGNVLSVNREARRIVGSLLGPERPLEELREVVTTRLADGREVTFDELKSAGTVRAQEVELSVPDGRSVCAC